jgi:hypothetical protein
MTSSVKSKVNLIIDALMLLFMMSMTGVGMLIRYVLVPGYRRNEIYGKGKELLVWGMDRHQWGTIHFALALVFSALLLLHIILHWNLIKCIYKKMIPHTTLRRSMAVFIVLVSAALAVGSLFLSPAIQSFQPGSNEWRPYSLNKKQPVHLQDAGQRKQYTHPDIQIFGYMTLREITSQSSIPVEVLAKVIHIPVSLADERLGRLRKKYGFEMESLRQYIRAHTKNN